MRLHQLFILISFFAILAPSSSLGRAGGGHTYSGSSRSSSSSSRSSSSHSSSSSNSNSGSTTVYYSSNRSYDNNSSGPMPIGFLLILVIVFIVVIYLMTRNNRKVSSSDELGFEIPHHHDVGRAANLDSSLATLLQEDSEFSLPLFKDFCYALYSTLHHARGKGSKELDHYRAYISDEAYARLMGMNQGVHPIMGVVIGAFDLQNIIFSADQVKVTIEFEANFTEDWGGGKQQSFYTEEKWTFVRKRGVKSRSPEKTRSIACPACGSPAQSDQHGKCPACANVIRSGVYDWFVEQIVVVELSNRPPLLTSTVEEEGTDLPTIYDPQLRALEPQLLADLNAKDLNAFNERTQKIFFELQKAWSARNIKSLRPYETDSMYETQLYWIEEYKKQHLVNRMDAVRIHEVKLCKIFYDAHYISVTVRIFAEMKDWTESESGALVSGSKSSTRAFTEYWTMIRSRTLTPPKGGFDQCPACGAELQISQAGVCSFCSSKISSGEFDWVLSSIEQDEAYRG